MPGVSYALIFAGAIEPQNPSAPIGIDFGQGVPILTTDVGGASHRADLCRYFCLTVNTGTPSRSGSDSHRDVGRYLGWAPP